MRAVILKSAFGETPQLLALFEQGFDVEQGVFEAELRGVNDANMSRWIAFSQHPAHGVDQAGSVVLAYREDICGCELLDSPIGRRHERARGPRLIHSGIVKMPCKVIPAPARWAGRRRCAKIDQCAYTPP